MASLTTNTPKGTTFQIPRRWFAKQWARLNLANPKETAPYKDPRVVQELRACARADVDRLLRHAR